MPFLTLNTEDSQLAVYYNNITNNNVFSGTPNNPNVTGTQKPEIPNERFLDFDDGFIRGGLVNAGIATAKDLIRIGKFITGIDNNGKITLDSAAKGILFLTKQAGLQLANPRLEWDRENVLPPFLGGPTRQFTGVGTLLSIGGSAFGLHFDRAGLLGNIRSNQKYGGDTDNPTSGVVYVNNFSGDNGNTDILGDIEPRNRLARYLRKIVNVDSSEGTSVLLDRYFGGSDSVYGIGYTSIRTSRDIRTTIRTNDLGIPEKTIKTEQQVFLYPSSPIDTTPFFGILGSNIPSLNTTALVDTVVPAISPNPDLSLKLNGFLPSTNKEIAAVPNVVDKASVSIPIPTTPSVSNITVPGYNIESRFGVSTNSNLDAINTINIVGSEFFYGNEGKNIADITKTDKDTPYNNQNIQGNFGTDLVKLRIEFLNNETLLTKDKTVNTDVLAFRAYLDDFSDGMAAKWDSYRYMGRGEEFYIYNGFTRDIAVSFTIHAHNEAEMAPLYNKLNYLMSTFTPDYSSAFKMRGNIGYLTVGDYLYRQPGIFTDIKIGGFMESSWETGLNDDGNANGQYQVPRMLKIGLSFKPIHTFLPRRNYRSTDASGKVGQVFQAPFITPDRKAYPIPDADGNKIANPYLTMSTNVSKNNDNSTYKAKKPKNIKAFQDWLDTNHAGWFPKGKGGKLNKKKGYGTFGSVTEQAWSLYRNEYNASQPK